MPHVGLSHGQNPPWAKFQHDLRKKQRFWGNCVLDPDRNGKILPCVMGGTSSYTPVHLWHKNLENRPIGKRMWGIYATGFIGWGESVEKTTRGMD